MGRRSRPDWGKITITVQKDTAHKIRISAAEQGCEMGTFVDGVLQSHYEGAVTGVGAPSPEPASSPALHLAQSFTACSEDRFRIAMLVYQEALKADGEGPIQPLAFLGDRENGFFEELPESTVLAILTAVLENIPASSFPAWDDETARQFNHALQGVDAFFMLLAAEALPLGEIFGTFAVIEGVGGALSGELVGCLEEDSGFPCREAASRVAHALLSLYGDAPQLFIEEGGRRSSMEWTSLLGQVTLSKPFGAGDTTPED